MVSEKTRDFAPDIDWRTIDQVQEIWSTDLVNLMLSNGWRLLAVCNKTHTHHMGVGPEPPQLLSDVIYVLGIEANVKSE